MTILACIPIELQGAPTFAEVIAASLTTADLTGELAAGQELHIQDSGGDDIAIFYEASKGSQFNGHVAVGDEAAIDTGGLYNFPSSIVLNIQESQSGVIGWTDGLALALDIDPSNDGALAVGLDLVAILNENSTATGVSLYGLQFGVNLNNDGDNYAYGLLGYAFSAGAGASYLYGGYFQAYTGNGSAAQTTGIEIYSGGKQFGSGTVNLNIGLLIDDQIGGVTNYAISTGLGKVRLGDIIDFAGAMGNSSKNPTTDAPADWVEIQIGGVTRYLPAYAA